MNVEVDLAAREDVPLWLAYGTPVFTVLAALAVSAVALLVIDVSPLEAYSTMFVDTLTSDFGQTETLIKSVPLILTGLAVYLPLKAGLFNIGAEGQLVFGAIAGTWIGLNVSLPAVALVPLMLFAAAVAGGFLAAIPAWLRAKWDVNEIITSLLLSFVALQIQSYLIRGPMQGGVGNFPQSARLSDAARIPEIFLGVHAGILVAVLMVVVTYLLMTRTRLGFEITFVGSNDQAAIQAGMSKYKVYLVVFILGGAFAGIAGISEIAGLQGRLRAGFEPGYGFTAIPIALLGRNSAIKVMLAGLFFALLFVGGTSMEVFLGVPAALVEIIQALVILFLITAEFFKSYRVSIGIDRKPSPTPAEPHGGDD
ncbi:ABC transporter permease [Salinibaculum salinum]|uniref:ABC transporter permease n=1 Tax=Salinibaculum salinum TaxID=3131996 RepID=UPI0030ECCEA2